MDESLTELLRSECKIDSGIIEQVAIHALLEGLGGPAQAVDAVFDEGIMQFFAHRLASIPDHGVEGTF